MFSGNRVQLGPAFSVGVSACLVTFGVVSSRESFVPGVLLSLCVLGTLAFTPRLNPILYWPVGLMAAVVIGYGAYLIDWYAGEPGISVSQARANVSFLLVSFGAIAALKGVLRPAHAVAGSWSRFFQPLMLSVAPAVVLFIGTRRLESESLALFSGYMSGGDHGLHNEIIHDLLGWSVSPSAENPFTLYTYPRGIHFLIAQLVAVGSSSSTAGSLVQEYLTGAWFEYVQLAAFLQLSIVIVSHWSRDQRWARTMFIAPFLLVFSSMDNFVAHLFWSGFMTSTAMTWALLLPIALWVGTSTPVRGARGSSEWFALWLVWLIFAWIVYQPYLMPMIAIGVIVAAVHASNKNMPGKVRPILSLTIRYQGTAAFLLSGVIAVSPYFVLGRGSPAIASLFLEGSTWRPHLGTVVVWVAMALVLCTIVDEREASADRVPTIVMGSLAGFSGAMAGIVFVVGDVGLFKMPYYIQKMFWTLLYVSIPIALGAGLSRGLRTSVFSNRGTRVGRLVALWIALILVPLVQGRTPNAATTHFSVDWFARGVFAVSPSDSEINGAFSMRDKLGSHMANLALRSASRSVLAPNVAISGNPYLACVELAKQGVARVYTTPNGRAELVESGCDPLISYVEDGVSVPSPTIKFFGVRSGVTETFSDKSLGFRLLLRGFRPPEKWGVWAGGYRSALGFQYEENLIDPMLELVVRSWPADEMLRTVRIGVNGTEDISRTLSLSGKTTIMVPLPVGAVGTPIELTLSCDRTSEEILEDDPADGPSPCVGLESMSLVARSG